MMATKQYEPDYAVPPGETIAETIAELGITQVDLASRLNMSAKTVNLIIHGKAPITHETAIALERVTGVSAAFWLKREALYQERLARLKDAERLEADLDWLDEFPRKELRDAGYLSAPKKGTEQLSELLAFFGVGSRAAWERQWKEFCASCAIAARKSATLKTSEAALATWIRMGELQAKGIECKEFNLRQFKKNVKEIRELTTLCPKTFMPKMRDLCADAGVAVVVVREVPKLPWHGASWWLTPKKAIIELNLRGKAEDQFWFSFFHEAGHIAKGHSKKMIFIDDDAPGNTEEDEANAFAANLLFPNGVIQEIPRINNREAMQRFAERIGICAGIVAGQYQRLTGRYNLPWVHSLIRPFTWETP